MFFTRDFVGGIGTMVIGLAYYIYAAQIRSSALDDSVGPAGLPKVYGMIMIGLGLVIAAGAILKVLRTRSVGLPVKSEWTGQGTKILLASGLLLIGIVYLLLVPLIGYALGIALLIFATAFYQGAPRSWRLIAIPVGGAIVLWCIFVLLLDVSMPSGSLLPL
jgi:putative tricarboxylic transport membrane protein